MDLTNTSTSGINGSILRSQFIVNSERDPQDTSRNETFVIEGSILSLHLLRISTLNDAEVADISTQDILSP